MPARDDIENVLAEERQILDLFLRSRSGQLPPVHSAELIGRYPATVIRITATREGETRLQEWSVWDGTLTGSPPGIGSGPDEYVQLLDVQILEWLASPTWKSHLPSS